MLGPEVLDRYHHQEILFKSTSAEAADLGWTLRGNLRLRGQTRPVTVHVTLKNGRYTGVTPWSRPTSGSSPPGKAVSELRTKSELSLAFGWNDRCGNIAMPVVGRDSASSVNGNRVYATDEFDHFPSPEPHNNNGLTGFENGYPNASPPVAVATPLAHKAAPLAKRCVCIPPTQPDSGPRAGCLSEL